MKSKRSHLGWVLLLSVLAAGCATTVPAPVVERGTTSAPTAAPVATPPGPGTYIVKKGDTLYSIAREHGYAPQDIAAWSNLADPTRLMPGQALRVSPPEGAPVAVAKPIGSLGAVEARGLDGNTDTLKRTPKAGKELYSEAAWARLTAQTGTPAAAPNIPQAPAAQPAPQAPTPAPVPAPAATANGADEPVWAWPALGRVLARFDDAGSKGIDIAGKMGDPVLASSDGKVVYSGTGLRGYGQLVIVKHNATYLTAYAHNSKILVKEGQSVKRGEKIAEFGNSDAEQVKLHFEVRRQGKPVDPLQHLPAR